MKSLLRYLSPFAPDLAGAVSVLFELEGLIAVCDAGGCTGNICGFDEPRWFTRKSALFSAGLRDMDAIMGRDRQLADKLIAAASQSKCNFMAMIGSPVPAVIGTDFNALKRMCMKSLDMPVIAVDASGTLNYEIGASAAYLELFKTWAVEKLPVKPGTYGVIGVTPLDFSTLNAGKLIVDVMPEECRVYGMGSGISEIEKASEVEKNIVTSPSGIKAAKYLERKFGTPWEIKVPFCPENIVEKVLSAKPGKILIVHQTFAAWELKNQLADLLSDCEIKTGSFFNKFTSDADYKFDSEEAFRAIFEAEKFDMVIADRVLARAVKNVFNGEWVDYPHFAVSGRLLED